MFRTTILFFLFCSLSLQAQVSEFAVHANGLIYSDTAMKQLHHIVDSLHLKYRSCGPPRTFYSVEQARACHIELEGPQAKQAWEAALKNVPWEKMTELFPQATTKESVVVTRKPQTNYQGRKFVDFDWIPARFDGSMWIDHDPAWYGNLNGQWVADYDTATTYSSERFRGLFFTSEFKKTRLPEKYAALVQYSECMIDTATRVFLADADNYDGYKRRTIDTTGEYKAFMDFVNRYPGKMKKFADWEKQDSERRRWEKARLDWVRDSLSGNAGFIRALRTLKEKALRDRISDGDVEYWVAAFLSPADALALKRSRIVYGSCSMDRSPRNHALQIALLSAEAVEWNVFLRAHLDIMNDNVSRVSDGSWAQSGRLTYLRELEELDINTTDLLLGICIDVSNPAGGHYYGDISRAGRALADSKYKDTLEPLLLSCIADSALDDLNRVCFFFLFNHYNAALEDKERRKSNEAKLRKAMATMPALKDEKIWSESRK